MLYKAFHLKHGRVFNKKQQQLVAYCFQLDHNTDGLPIFNLVNCIDIHVSPLRKEKLLMAGCCRTVHLMILVQM